MASLRVQRAANRPYFGKEIKRNVKAVFSWLREQVTAVLTFSVYAWYEAEKYCKQKFAEAGMGNIIDYLALFLLSFSSPH